MPLTLYRLKPAFQSLLRPLVTRLARRGVTANVVTTAALLGSVALGALLDRVAPLPLDAAAGTAQAPVSAEAGAILASDREANLAIAQFGLELLRQHDEGIRAVLTHGNAGALAGGGIVRLGQVSHVTAAYRQSLIIGEGGTGAPGAITLDGGVLEPGLDNDVGTLAITTEMHANAKPIPVTLANGTFQVDIAGAGVCDVLSTMGAVNIDAGGNLAIDVDVNGAKLSIGQQWTVLTSASGPVADGNGGKLFDAITDNSDRVNFAASIALDGKSLVLTALDANPGTVLVVR